MHRMNVHCSVESFFGCHDDNDGHDDGDDNGIDNKRMNMDSTSTLSYKRRLRRGLWAENDYELGEKIVRQYHLLNDANYVNARGHEREAKIPNLIHFIWLGPKKLPSYPTFGEHSICKEGEHWNETMASWKMHHPHWEIKLWNDEHIESLQQDPNQPECSTKLNPLYHHCVETSQYGMASDIARLQILYAHGGVYADIDYVCTRSFEDLHEDEANSFDFYCGASNTGCIEMNNGLIGSIPYHFFVKTLMERIAEWDRTRTHTCASAIKSACSSVEIEQLDRPNQAAFSILSSFLDEDTLSSLQSSTKAATTSTISRNHFKPMEVIEHTGPGLLTRELLKLFQDESMEMEHSHSHQRQSIAVMPSCTFNALPNTHRHLLLKDAKQNDTLKDQEEATSRVQDILNRFIYPDKTRAIHLWSCSWQS